MYQKEIDLFLVYCNLTFLEQSIEILPPSHENILHCVQLSMHNMCLHTLKSLCYVYMFMCGISVHINVCEAFEIML